MGAVDDQSFEFLLNNFARLTNIMSEECPTFALFKSVFRLQLLFIAFKLYYLLTNWLEYLYGRIQSPRPDVMPDRREGITRAAGFVFACIDTQAS